MKTRTHRLWTVALAFVTAQALSIAAWVLATALLRHQHGGDVRPAPYHGVLGWLSWDGGFYRLIAQHGYQVSSPESIRFFPLYPMAGRIVAIPLGGNTDLGLLLVAKIAVIVAAWGIHRLVVFEGFAETAADRSVWVWMLFPGAFVLSWAYSEALFVALAVWAIWALRHRRWWSAALLGLAAGLCRPLGVALAAAAVVEALRAGRSRDAGDIAGRCAAVIAAPLGVAAFCWYAASRGFGFWEPFRIQDQLRHNETPFTRLWSLPQTLTGHESFTTGLHVPFVVGFLVLAIIAFRRLPASYGIFAAVILTAALSARNLNSIERYATSAFPLAVAGALTLEGRERAEPAVYAAGGALAIGLCALALSGAYVP